MLAISKIVVHFDKDERQVSLLEWFVGVVFGVGLFISLVARVFLFVESFLALRHVNEEAFQSVGWAHTWPHLG